MDRSGAVVGLGDARVQARQCYDNLAAILAHYGASLRHLIKTTTYITHWGYRPLVATARDELFPAHPYPANTLVVVAGLAEPHFIVGIEGLAGLGYVDEDETHGHRTHVQDHRRDPLHRCSGRDCRARPARAAGAGRLGHRRSPLSVESRQEGGSHERTHA